MIHSSSARRYPTGETQPIPQADRYFSNRGKLRRSCARCAIPHSMGLDRTRHEILRPWTRNAHDRWSDSNEQGDLLS